MKVNFVLETKQRTLSMIVYQKQFFFSSQIQKKMIYSVKKKLKDTKEIADLQSKVTQVWLEVKLGKEGF